MMDAFQTRDVRGDFPQGSRSTPQQDDLQAVIVIDMNMSGGNDGMVVIVLDCRQTLFKFTLVVIIHERQHGECRRLVILNPIFIENGAHEITDSL